MIVIFWDSQKTLDFFLEKVTINQEFQYMNSTFYYCSVDSTEVISVFPGYGKINIGAIFGYLVCTCKIDTIISAGTCSTLDSSCQLRTLSIGECALQWDVNYSPLGTAPPNIHNETNGIFYCSKTLIELAKTLSFKSGYPASVGRFASADSLDFSNSSSASLISKYHVDFIDSDSGSIGQLSSIFSTPYIIIKAVSRNVSDDFLYNTANEYLSAYVCVNVVYELLKYLSRVPINALLS